MPLGADLLSKFRKDKTKEGVAQRPVADVRDKYNFSGFATLILYTIFLHVRLKIIVVSICNIFFSISNEIYKVMLENFLRKKIALYDFISR